MNVTKLSQELANQIRADYAAKRKTWTQLLREHHISGGMLGKILRDDAWSGAKPKLGDKWTGERIQAVRDARSWNNADLAAALGCCERTIEAYLQDRETTSARIPGGARCKLLEALESDIMHGLNQSSSQ